MTQPFPHLFSPLKLNSKTLKLVWVVMGLVAGVRELAQSNAKPGPSPRPLMQD